MSGKPFTAELGSGNEACAWEAVTAPRIRAKKALRRLTGPDMVYPLV